MIKGTRLEKEIEKAEKHLIGYNNHLNRRNAAEIENRLCFIYVECLLRNTYNSDWNSFWQEYFQVSYLSDLFTEYEIIELMMEV